MPTTADRENVALFGTLAADWWDPDGASKLLHRVNPARLGFVRDAAIRHFGRSRKARRALEGLCILDVGCGGGLLAEPLARMGANVTGIDAGEDVIATARAHAAGQGLTIDYRSGDVVRLAEEIPGQFDLVTCLEVLEHVTDLQAFLLALRKLLKPGGMLVYSTPNRTLMSWAVLIVGAEQIVKLIPRGAHDWKQFLTPDELTMRLAAAGLVAGKAKGISWTPARGFIVNDDVRVNYIGTAVPA
ncbi:MAG: bifunctional 2-polyprenyl-6-hydroxyphenol methylase/3-demethylubiquinol 3-O-methyltransferase UbiG [Sandarakinorhabdus sp.]|nr:bifunctional 2-polyprenyl-6-hydroxyphenol methylase/3-demethylubiquinol 3-O-methyltransferase UbiG [Sandarakinorhabdus sp.]